MMNTDLLDEYCMNLYGHTGWYQNADVSSMDEGEEYISIVFPKESNDE